MKSVLDTFYIHILFLVQYCATRLRFKLVDESKADKQKIECLEGVVSVIISGGQFQVVIGSTVQYVYRDLMEVSNLGGNQESSKQSDDNGNIFNKIIDIISAIFTPILGAMIGSGIIKGLLMLATMYGGLDETTGTYRVLYAASNAVFYFLPIILAYTSAKKFKANIVIAMVVAGALVYPDMVSAYSNGEYLSFLGIPIIMINYTSSVIPIILSTWFLSKLERLLEKLIPDIVKSFLIPLFSLVIVIPITYLIIGPIGYYVGLWVANGYSLLYDLNPIIAGFILGDLYQSLVVFGLHWALGPIQINNVAVYGYDTITAMYLPAKYAQAGATLGISIKTKNKELKSAALTTAITTALFGITEPAVYGFTLKYKKPFICASIAGAIGGAISGAFRVSASAYGISNTLTLTVFLGHGFLGIIIAIVTAFLLSLILTYLFGYNDSMNETILDSFDTSENTLKEENVFSPLHGNIIPLADVKDEAFAQEVLGRTIAIEPLDGAIIAPFEGTVETLASTKHAIGIKSKNGMELLIHVGIDTIELNGDCFLSDIKENSSFKRGDVLLRFDYDEMQKRGYDVTTFIIVTNSDEYSDIKISEINVVGGYWTLGTYIDKANTDSTSKIVSLANNCAPEEAAIKMQAIHNLMVASSLANKLGHEINPNFKMGCMLALSGIYPNTCHPDDMLGAMQLQKEGVNVR